MKSILTILFLFVSLSTYANDQILTPVSPRTMAPAFSLFDIDGKKHHLKNYRGKVVIINFWATWCPPCRLEIPSMQRAWKKLKNKNVAMLAINIGENDDTIFTFSAEYEMDFPILMDKDSRVIRSWPVSALPTTYVVDRKGRLAYRAIGDRQWDNKELIKLILNLTKE